VSDRTPTPWQRGASNDGGRPTRPGTTAGRPIEDAIIRATLDELADHGIDGVSIERVAAAAEVNKTTVYRRFPTKEALIGAALEFALVSLAAQIRDTGSLRGDLIDLVHKQATVISSASGRALVRAGMSEQMASSLAELAADPLTNQPDEVRLLVERAVQRCEWDIGRCPPDPVFAMMTGGLIHRIMMERQPVSDAWAANLVDIVARGVAPDLR
jgi:AcrR family transcriptional regulator